MTPLNKKIFSVLFFSIFTVVTGVGIVVPLLPVYVHNLGAGGVYIAMVFGSFPFPGPYCFPISDGCRIKKGENPLLQQAFYATR